MQALKLADGMFPKIKLSQEETKEGEKIKLLIKGPDTRSVLLEFRPVFVQLKLLLFSVQS